MVREAWQATVHGVTKSRTRVSDYAQHRTVALQAPLSMGFSRQEHWSGLPFPPPADLPDPRMEPASPALQRDSLLSKPPGNQHRGLS